MSYPTETAGQLADRCRNCGVDLQGAYCHACGQKHVDGRLDSKALFSQLFEALTESDGTLWQTLRKLTRNPGRVALDYIDGGRARYLNPVRFLLVAFTIYFGLMVLTGAQVDIANRMDMGLDVSELDAATKTFLAYLTSVIASQMDVVVFFAIPLLAFVIRWQYFLSRRNYAETFTFVCFVFGLGYLYASLLVPFQFVFDISSASPKNVITGILFIFGARTFFAMKWPVTIIAGGLTAIAYFATITGVSMAIAITEIYLDQWL